MLALAGMSSSMKQNTPNRPRPGAPQSARAHAHALLMLVLGEKCTLDEALAKHPLSGAEADQRFAMLLALSTLQHLGQLDAVLAKYLEKPLPQKRLTITNALRLGAAQLLLLETPAHAAVNETVTLVKAGKDAGLAGLVNAVLQKMVREKATLPAPIENLPKWLRARWEKAYGTDVVAAMAQVAATRAPLDIHSTVDMQGAVRLDLRMQRFAGDHLPVEHLAGYASGAFFVQDVAASYPVRMLGDVSQLQVLDVCAAPGGKAMQLIQAGAFVTAIDKSAARMKRVKENLKRMNMQANTIVVDAFKWQPSRAYDAILLDAPCSATGTWRRHPEVVHCVSEADITEMVALQRQLLLRAWEWLKPNGKMVYCVCSLEPEEGEQQAAWFMNEVKNAAVVAANKSLNLFPWERSARALGAAGEGIIFSSPLEGERDLPLQVRGGLIQEKTPPTETLHSVSTPPQGGSKKGNPSHGYAIPPACITPEGYLRTRPDMLAEQGGMDGFFAVCFTKV